MLASQIIISLTAEPPEVVDVNKSYATSATTEPLVVCDQVQTAGIDWMAESCLLMPEFTLMLVKLLTPVPPVQVQVVFHAKVVPVREVRDAQSEPEDTPDRPHWSSRREYVPAVTVSHWPQWLEVSMVAAGSSTAGVGDAEMKGTKRSSTESFANANMIDASK